jgi:hypothetical protein
MLSRTASMMIDAILEAEANGVYFTEGRIQWNAYSNECRFVPRYNSWGQRNW